MLRRTQTIARPVADVFDVVVHAGDFATWNPTISSSRQLSKGEPGEGTRAEWTLRGFGPVQQVLHEVEPGRRVRIVPDDRRIAGGHRFTLTAEGDGRTRVDHELEMQPKGVYVLMAPMMKMVGSKNLRATADALQRHLERRTSG